jgi:hypothetical protein
MKIKYAIIFILIFIYMTTILWGNLPMSQDDNRTIAEYVADMIAEHNESADSHNLPNQSLYVHKANDIIDHPAGSVKNDKTSYHDLFYDLRMADTDFWFIYSNVTEKAFSKYDDYIVLETSNPTQKTRFFRRLPDTIIKDTLVPSTMLSMKILSENDAPPNFYYKIGYLYPVLVNDYSSGLMYENNKWYVYLADVNYYAIPPASATYHIDHFYKVEITDLNLFDNVEHEFRLYYSRSEKKFQWVIDGQIIHEYFDDDDYYSKILDYSFGAESDYVFDEDYPLVLNNYAPVFTADWTY